MFLRKTLIKKEKQNYKNYGFYEHNMTFSSKSGYNQVITPFLWDINQNMLFWTYVMKLVINTKDLVLQKENLRIYHLM